jgi:hypothetical protein
MYEGYPESKGTTRVGGEGKSPQTIPLTAQTLFAVKETSGRPEVSRKEVKSEVTTWLRAQTAEFCDIGVQELVHGLNKCLDKGGDYVEK